MSKRNLLTAVAAILLVTAVSFAFAGLSGIDQDKPTYKELWSKVEKLEKDGKPQAALKYVMQVREKARLEDNQPQLIKSVVFEIDLKNRFVEDQQQEAVKILRSAFDLTNDKVAQAILHSMLAGAYNNYRIWSRYRTSGRTELVSDTSDNISQWSGKRLVKESIRHYQASLKNKKLLSETSLKDYDEIILRHINQDDFLHNIYDLLAIRALEFYGSEPLQLKEAGAENDFSEAGYFKTGGEFHAINIGEDENDYRDLAIRIFQNLLSIHKNDADPFLTVYFDLQRLQYVRDKSLRSDAAEMYRFALENLLEKHQDNKVSTRIQYNLALYWQARGEKYNRSMPGDEHKWDLVKAKEYCQSAIEKFPKSFGAQQCEHLLEKLQAATARLKTDQAVIPGEPVLASLHYKNIDTLHFSIYKMDYYKWSGLSNHREELLTELKNLESLRNWSVKIPDDGDMQEHVLELSLPELNKGHYIILFSDDKEITYGKSLVNYVSLFSSRLSVVLQSRHSEKDFGYVLDREKGEALKDVKLRFLTIRNNYRSKKVDAKVLGQAVTDAGGYFSFDAGGDYRRYFIEATRGDDKLITGEFFQSRKYSPAAAKENISTRLFTDRSIYRPGQTIHFKGIVLGSKEKSHKIKSDFPVNVQLRDANHETVKEQKYTTNEYGSFNGSFVLPATGLTGNFQLQTKHGSISFRVEEYKRPRFEVELQKVEKSFKLNQKIAMKGKAEAYAGSKISNAKVSYEVTRSTYFFPWQYRYGYLPPPNPSGGTVIKTGQTETDENGNFTISFTAIPGEKQYRHDPVFRYVVKVDVTDINGETRSDSRTVSAGEKALVLDVDIPEKVNRTQLMEYKISAENLDGASVNASGHLKIERLQQPERLLKKRSWEIPDNYALDKSEFEKIFPHEQYKTGLDKNLWKVEKQVFNCNFDTENSDSLFMNCAADWNEGVYRLTIKANDAFGEEVERKKYFTLYDPETDNMPEKTFFFTEINKTTAEPGEELNLLFGSSAKDAGFYLSWGMDNQVLGEKKIKLSEEKKLISIPVEEAWRGGFYIYIFMQKDNVLYYKKYHIDVPYSNKKLKTQLITFRDKMKPGAQEQWKIRLSGPKGEEVAAEMLASMYDASLDQFTDHSWSFPYMHQNAELLRMMTGAGRSTQNSIYLSGFNSKRRMPHELIREQLIPSYYSFGSGRFRVAGNIETFEMLDADDAPLLQANYRKSSPVNKAESEARVEDSIGNPSQEKKSTPALRTNFSETAFFYPTLRTNEDGEILLEFTMPESVTRWKFMTLSHTKDLKYDLLTKNVQTQKELMVMPNMPRFLRESDTITVSTKISNLTAKKLDGTATIKLFDPVNMKEITDDFSVNNRQKAFTVDQDGNTSVAWKMAVPLGYEAITWRITAETENHSDGEEKLLPVLPNRRLVTESMPMSVRKNKTKEFSFDKLLNSGESNTLEHYRYTLEVTQNPAWYAVQALPYLAEFPHECSEQIFSRYYANTLAGSIANANPKIKKVFDAWRNIEPDAMMSKLQQNEELKSIVLSETPWVRDAKNEAEQKRRIAMLFDLNTMSNQQDAALSRLQKMQLNNGGWPWFGGSYPSRYITQHIVAGFGHMQVLNVADIRNDREVRQMIRVAVSYLDEEIKDDFNRVKEHGNLQDNNLENVQVQYLYARSFFMKDFPLHASAEKAYQFYLGQAKQYWLKQNIYLQGMLALALHRQKEKTALKIMESIKDKALYDEEMGMYWRRNNGWYWSQAPIERQALLIEAFDEILDDSESVEEMKLWLLKQKQTQSWETTKATAEAVYALLLRGADLLSTGNTVELTVADQRINPTDDPEIDTEAGTGYFKKVWNDVKPGMGKVVFENSGQNVAWGAVYWQYFEQLDKITGHDSPLSMQKELFKEIKTGTGRKLQALKEDDPIQPGDRVIVRIMLSTDRDMEFVHLSDMRASGLEPVNVLSQMKYQDGLHYYESTKDAATHFFFDWLPKGKYVFEYPLYAAQKGNFSNGISTVQCMYAPEFAAHSRGIRISIE